MGMSRSECWRLWEASREAVMRMSLPPLPVPPLVPPVPVLKPIPVESYRFEEGC